MRDRDPKQALKPRHLITEGALLLHAGSASLAALVTTAWGLVYVPLLKFRGEKVAVPMAAPLMLAAAVFVVLAMVAVRLRRAVASDQEGGWLTAGYFLVAAIGCVGGSGFFRDVMHDVALTMFDSHGRFGCVEGSPIIRDATLTAALFVAPPVVAGIHFIHAWISRCQAAAGLQ